MPCDYRKYPKNWKTEIRPRILKRAGNKCECCGIKNYDIGYRDTKGNWFPIEQSHQGDVDAMDAELAGFKIIKIILTIAHLDNNTTNNVDENLRALCQKCHLSLDGKLHKKNARETRNKKKGLMGLGF